MTNSMPATECHITSLVVQAVPACADAIVEQVRGLPGAEVHRGEPANKFVVLLETDTEQEILDVINDLQKTDGVLSATMVYHQVD